MEQDQRICPRCGEPAGEYRFCASCRSQIAGPRADDASHPATHALREVLRLEEALAAASKGISDRIAARSPAAAVQVEQDPAPASDGSAGVLEIPKLGTSQERGADAPPSPRAVARLEDVLTVAPRDRAPGTPPPAPAAVERVAPEPVAPPERVAPEPVAAESVAPPAPPAESVAPPAPAERKGFWFEYVPAPQPADDDRACAVETPELEPAAEVEPITAVEPEPVAAEVPTTTPRNHWLTVLCLLALVGLVMALTGRNPRRAG